MNKQKSKQSVFAMQLDAQRNVAVFLDGDYTDLVKSLIMAMDKSPEIYNLMHDAVKYHSIYTDQALGNLLQQLNDNPDDGS